MAFEDGALKIEVALRIPIRVKVHGVRAAIGEKLSERERQVLAQLLTGKSNKEIANALGVAMRTVKFHVSSILMKASASDRLDLMAKVRKAESCGSGL